MPIGGPFRAARTSPAGERLNALPEGGNNTRPLKDALPGRARQNSLTRSPLRGAANGRHASSSSTRLAAATIFCCSLGGTIS